MTDQSFGERMRVIAKRLRDIADNMEMEPADREVALETAAEADKVAELFEEKGL